MCAFRRYVFAICLQIVVVMPLVTRGQESAWVNMGKDSHMQFGELPDTASIVATIKTAQQLNSSDLDSSYKLAQTALQQSRQIDFPYGIVSSLLIIAHYYSDNSQYNHSLMAFREALPHCGRSPQAQMLLSTVYGGIAVAYHMQNHYEKAIYYYYRALLSAERMSAPSGMDYTYSNMAGIFNLFGQSELALSYLKKAEQIALKENHMNILESALVNRGVIYITQEKWDTAMKHFEKTLYLARKYQLSRAQYFALTNIASLHLRKDDPAQALIYTRQALNVTRNVSPAYINSAWILLGKTLYRLKRYQDAEDTLLLTLSTAKKLNIGKQMAESHEALAHVYAATGRYHQAYESYKEYVAIKDSIESRHIAQTVSQLEMKFRVAEKDKELYRQRLLIYQQQRRIDRKNLLIISTTTGTFVLTVLLVALYRNRRHKQQIVQLKAMMTGEEKERNRIGRELHDGIGGMLTAINMNLGAIQKRHQNLPEMKEFDAVITMLQNMAAEIRKTSHNLMPDILLRHGFPETLRMYCEQVSSGSNLQIDLQCYGNLDDIDRSLAFSLYRIIQELIQNIVKHAHASYVVIQIREYEQRLTISVEDDGVGFNPRRASEGAGLNNIRSRTQALSGHIAIESSEGRGTTVYLEFDLQKINNQ
jgi:signal transduction histidine kinase